MSALAARLDDDLRAPRELGPRREDGLDSVARLFAERLLSEQAVPRLARRGASRALALLLARSEGSRGPVTLSAAEGARLCGFEPRTWWLVKRRLLELGHLVATTGGAPPSGRPGGRGKKGAYCVAPETLARFEETLMAPSETVNARTKTLNPPPKMVCDFSQHPASHRHSLRLLEKKRTSDVSSLEGDEERPSVAAVWAWAQREERPRVQVALLRLLETLLLTEALAGSPVRRDPRGGEPETVMAPPPETVMPPPRRAEGREAGKARRARAGAPLWSGASGEEAEVLAHVRSILEWANKEHGARFEVKKSSQDTLLYPFERVRSAVANVLLKRARGYRFENPGAVLWDGITLEDYKLEEFSVASLEEVKARLERTSPKKKEPQAAAPAKERGPLVFEPEKERRTLLQALYQKLPLSEQRALDERSEALARAELGEAALTPMQVARLALRKLDKRNELLAGLADLPVDAGVTQRAPRESQIPESGSTRHETEPNPHVPTRT